MFQKKQIPPARTEKDKKLITESGLSRNTPVSSTWIEPLYLASLLIFMVIFNSDILKYWSRRLNEFALQFKDLISPLSINSIHCTSLKRKLIKLSGGALSRIKPWIWKKKTGRYFQTFSFKILSLLDIMFIFTANWTEKLNSREIKFLRFYFWCVT